MERVVKVNALPEYRLFSDGTRGVVDLSDRLFSRVFVDEFGAIAWPNGADLAPDALYERLKASRVA